MTVQTTGPSENANEAMNTTRATSVSTPATETPSAPPAESVLKKANDAPTPARLTVMPTRPASSSGRRPKRST